jgi:hypothetical protein
VDRRLSYPSISNPPKVYSQRYMFDLSRSINDLITYIRAPGEGRNSSLVLTNAPTDEVGLEAGTIYDDLGVLRIAHATQYPEPIGAPVYMRIYNNSGSTINKGVCVGFSGVNPSNGYIEATPYLADGVTPTLYFIGVTNETIINGAFGIVITWGIVSGIDTSAFSVGNILYASPSTAGGLTATKPTAADNVIPVAACLIDNSSTGAIFVRPTIEQQKYYGEFTKTSNQTVAAIDTAYAISWDNTEIAEGVSLTGSPLTRLTVANSGLYQFNVEYQIASGSSSAKNARFWFKRNGTTNYANSTRIMTTDINNGYMLLSMSEFFSLDANDYVECMWASDDTNVSLSTVASTAYCPAAPAGIVSVTQIQQ